MSATARQIKDEPKESAFALDVHSLPSVAYSAMRELPRVAAVYFVMKDDAILYIGRSGDLRTRWMGAHGKKYDLAEIKPTAIAWLEVEERDEQAAMERTCIARFSPPLNLKKPRRAPVAA